jgi:hypothetical protein
MSFPSRAEARIFTPSVQSRLDCGASHATRDHHGFDDAGGDWQWLVEAMMEPHVMSKKPRFPQLTMDQLNDEQNPLAEQIMKVSKVGLGGPYNPLLRSPVLGQKMFDLLHYLRWRTSVPLKLNEFAILIIGRQWRSQVEWFAHAPLAIEGGCRRQS